MRFDNLITEAEVPKVAIIFGRFNPPHFGHKGAWQKAAQYDNWYVGTNPNTQGAKGKSGKAAENKDPLPYEVKIAAMQAIMPEIKGHIIPETNWWSLATAIYNKHGKVHLVIISDAEDGAGFVKGLAKSNGVEGRHGYYNFADITHDAAPRASSATDLRAAIRAGDKDAFAKAAGVDADMKIQGKSYFDLVSHYLMGTEMKESDLSKAIKSVSEDVMNPTVGNYDLETLQRKVARDFAQAAEAMATANSKREWTNALYQIKNNTMYQVQEIIDAYEALGQQRKKGGPASRGIDANRVESRSMLGRVVAEQDLEEGVNDPHIFKAVFLAGGPGSGKSFVSDKLMRHNGLRVVNSDDIYEYLMKKQNLPLDPETIFSPQGQEIRGRAKDLTKVKKKGFLDGRIGLIIDGTGKDVDKVARERAKLQELGYDTMMLFVNTSHDVAQERNKQRERSLEPGQVTKMWNRVQDNIMKFQQVFGAGNFLVLDNSGGLEDPTRAEEFHKVWKHIEKFVNSEPSSHIAKKWIDAQRKGDK